MARMTSFKKTADARVAIVGLGYVGLPLAVEFGKHLDTLGFDIDAERIAELKAGNDRTLETDASELAEAKHLRFSTDLEALRGRDVYIVTVPTPIDAAKRPDISALRAASRTVGQVLGKGAIVVYESTVYPGCTEEDCAPILEQLSGLKLNKDFFVGYSPERINPGDKEHRLPTIRKITSGSTPMQWPPTRPGRKGRKFHLVPAACSTSSVSRPMRLKISASSLISAMLTSRCVFSMTLAASATRMLEAG